jgi:MEKHLA domain
MRRSGICLQLALDTFEAEWDELVGLKSSASVVQGDETMQQGREAALNETAESEMLVEVPEARARRVSLKGTEFTLKGAKLWNIMNPIGAQRAGQPCRLTSHAKQACAALSSWRPRNELLLHSLHKLRPACYGSARLRHAVCFEPVASTMCRKVRRAGGAR